MYLVGASLVNPFLLFWLPLFVAMVWYCFRHARHSLSHGLGAIGLGSAACVGNAVLQPDSWAFGAIVGLMSAAGWYGATRILDRHRGLVRVWSGGPRSMVRLVGIGLVVGLVLGVVNLFLPGDAGVALGLPSLPDTARAVAGALRPGIWEEVAFHFFPLAWWIAVRGAVPGTRWGTVGLYTWLVLPHAAMHFSDSVTVDPVGAVVGTLGLGVVFGLPLVWLNVRRGVVAAVVAHWAVDALRFALGYW